MSPLSYITHSAVLKTAGPKSLRVAQSAALLDVTPAGNFTLWSAFFSKKEEIENIYIYLQIHIDSEKRRRYCK